MKTIEWERLEISSRKLEIPREYFMHRWVQKKKEMVWTYEKQNILRKGGKDIQKNHAKKIFMIQIIMMV